ncbi:uncharacterized protein FFNC_00042 [Fusarium fujikuroi]|nr:uncharacterized protein FFC1_00042 [Fusarium fujikuroi]SCO27951.1 uncharacterized protein FFNC_00042 [Fusarium fujikuroi]SCV25982.1 uncharacterized protein FFFS_00042 [Fusarium fujikuroi]
MLTPRPACLKKL